MKMITNRHYHNEQAIDEKQFGRENKRTNEWTIKIDIRHSVVQKKKKMYERKLNQRNGCGCREYVYICMYRGNEHTAYTLCSCMDFI